MGRELVRKMLHTGLAFLFIGVAPYFSRDTLIVGAFVFFCFFSLLRIARVYALLPMVLRVTFGELFFALGIVGTILLAWPDIQLFQLGLLVLAVADPLAALIGMRFGRHTYTVLDEKRSLEGSFACAVTVFCIFLAFGSPLYVAGASAVALSVVEAVSLRGSDNLFLPTVAVLLFHFFL